MTFFGLKNLIARKTVSDIRIRNIAPKVILIMYMPINVVGVSPEIFGVLIARIR